MKPKRLTPRIAAALAAPLLLLIAALLWPGLSTDRTTPEEPAAPAREKAAVTVPPEVARRGETPVLRPLPVTRTSDTHEWTSADATAIKVIEKLAHNPEEFIRLVEENDRIKRRQLVYRKVTVPTLIEQSAGVPITEFTLPGLDGREIQVDVTETRLNGTAGSVIGRVKGRMNSSVSVGFSNGCESFNIISPDEDLFLVADAREPGEVLVKEIDPDEYMPPAGMGADFVRRASASK